MLTISNPLPALRSLAVTAAELRNGVYAPMWCDGHRGLRTRISRRENSILLVHGKLLCPCGGTEEYVGPADLADMTVAP